MREICMLMKIFNLIDDIILNQETFSECNVCQKTKRSIALNNYIRYYFCT
jgi:hypothetical protein